MNKRVDKCFIGLSSRDFSTNFPKHIVTYTPEHERKVSVGYLRNIVSWDLS